MLVQKLGSFFLLITTILLFGCKDKKTVHQTDLDNLYAHKRTKNQKDSIANKYTEVAFEVLQLVPSNKKNKQIDNLISKLRWSSNENLFLKLVKTAEKEAKEQHDIIRLAQLYENVAVYYHDEQKLDSVYTYYLKAEHLYKKNGDSIALAENIYYQARLLFEVEFIQESESKLNYALNILKKNPSNPVNIEAKQFKTFYRVNTDQEKKDRLVILEGFYSQLKKDEGIYTILPKEKFKLAFSSLCANIALSYLELGQLDKAENFCLEGLDYIKDANVDQLHAHLSWTYYQILYLHGAKKNIIKELTDCYNIYIKLNLPLYAISLSTYIADMYREQNQFDQSLDWMLKGYELADKNKYYKQKKQVIEQLLKAYPNYQTEQLIIELIDASYLVDEQQKTIKENFIKIKFDAFILGQENTVLKQRVFFMCLIIAGLITSLVFTFMVVRLRNKNRQLDYLYKNKVKNEQILALFLEKNNIENQAILKERKRIAKDLHDGVINNIFTLRFNTQLLQVSNEKLKTSLINELITLENRVRSISHSLGNQDLFQNKSFEKSLKELVNKQNIINKTNYSFECDTLLGNLSNEKKINIYQIIQECFQNINKHAYATKCKLSITSDNGYINFCIQDNGLGIRKTSHQGIGLRNIKERAYHISGKLKIVSKLNKGTTIFLYVPM